MVVDMIAKEHGRESIGTAILDKMNALPAWSTTPRPSPQSTILSRFLTASSLVAGGNLEAPDGVETVIRAQADVSCYHTDTQPMHLAIGPGYMTVVCKPGGEGGDFVLYLSDLSRCGDPKGPEVHPNGCWKSAEEVEGAGWQRDYSGLSRQFLSLRADSKLVWGEGDNCIRAFDPLTGRIKHTLAAGGGLGWFGLTDAVIFKSKSKGQFVTWDKANLDGQAWSKVRLIFISWRL